MTHKQEQPVSRADRSGDPALSEEEEWVRMTPVERYIESAKLWAVYLNLGGSLDPQPDSQSPLDCPELERATPPDGRAGVRFIRRGG